MTYAVLVTVLILLHYLYLSYNVGAARGKTGIQAPRVTGDEFFERTLRVQINTLEQLIVTLPALWMCAVFYREDAAALLGFIFLIGRIMYATAYVSDPATRGKGMLIGFLANVLMLVGAVYGVLK